MGDCQECRVRNHPSLPHSTLQCSPERLRTPKQRGRFVLWSIHRPKSVFVLFPFYFKYSSILLEVVTSSCCPVILGVGVPKDGFFGFEVVVTGDLVVAIQTPRFFQRELISSLTVDCLELEVGPVIKGLVDGDGADGRALGEVVDQGSLDAICTRGG